MPGFFARKKAPPEAAGEGIRPPGTGRRSGPHPLLGSLGNGPKVGILLVLMLLVGGSLVSRVKAPPPDSNARKIDRAQLSLANLRVALDIFRHDVGAYPSEREGLASLVHPPTPHPRWAGPYIHELKNDLWGSPFQYRLDGGTNVILFGCGPDRAPGTADDIRVERADIRLERNSENRSAVHAVVVFRDGSRKIVRETVDLEKVIPARINP